MPPTPTLDGERLRLRPPQPSDKADRLAVPLDPGIVRALGGNSTDLATLTAVAVDAWYNAVASGPYSWMIEHEGRCIGTARLHSLDQQHRRARYAVGIFDPSLIGRGLGTEVTQLVLTYAFDTLDLHRVDLRVLAFNIRAQRTYERCGFKREGTEREAAWVDGQWIDDIIMSLLESEWRAQQSAEQQ